MRALFRRRSLVVVLLLVGLFVGTGCRNPVNPSGGYDPSKPVSEDNWPPSPPAGTQNLIATYDVSTGDCSSPADVYNCPGDMQPTNDSTLARPGFDYTYILKNHTQVYTIRVCITHPGWPGRRVSATANGMNAPSAGIPVTDESSLPQHICIADSFNLEVDGGVTHDGFGSIYASEGGWDMREPIYVNKKFNFVSAIRW